jgi:neutral amino acid transport system ATP-binding protein
MEINVLEIEGVTKKFGEFYALNNCNLSIGSNQITGIIGPNGAGKSTLFNILGGLIRPDSGQIILNNHNVTGLRPDQLVKTGVIRTFQISRELGELTVLENMLLAELSNPGDVLWKNFFKISEVKNFQDKSITKAKELIKNIGLSDHINSSAKNLSGGQKKLLEIARALMTNPRLILLDEPTAGVSPPMCSVLMNVIENLRKDGITFVIIEHDMEMIAKLCQKIYVLAEGKNLTSGTYKEVTANEDVMRAYLGKVAIH